MFKPPRKVKGQLPKSKSCEMEALKVFCRIRPIPEPCDSSWLSAVSDNLLVVSNPDPSKNANKVSHHKFKKIFTEGVSQKSVFDAVALPMVSSVLQGKNSLLFAYGITGSGKSFTMNGSSKDGGILPRCLDVIFNSIADFQTKKHIFKPDKLNGFEIQSESDAVLDQHQDLVNHITNVKSSKTKPFSKNSDPDLAERFVDPTRVESIDEENSYAVFVTYVEIYNNNVFDLLEETLEENPYTRQFQNKIIREDSGHNMYVHGVSEIEVSSTEEAFEVFCRGQKKRKIAHTSLNSESSRSHSVFTIRVVQAALEEDGDTVHLSRRPVGIGQLSLVDLAGSERTNRTNNTGMRLREAGNINNSLMNLRTCLELLRENQAGGTKVIPYRDYRLTHLFKSYFEGEGQVSMIVCLNPHPDNYEESLHVLKFAEMSQEVQVKTQTPLKPLSAYTPGRRRLNEAFREAMKKLEVQTESSEDVNSVEIASSVKSEDVIPPFKFPVASRMGDFNTEKEYAMEVCSFVDTRRDFWMNHNRSASVNSCKIKLLEALKDAQLGANELTASKLMHEHEKEKVKQLEEKNNSLAMEINMLKRKYEEQEKENKRIKTELNEKEHVISKKNAEKDKVKEKFIHKTAEYQEKINREFQYKLRRQKTEMEMELRNKDKKLREVQRVLSDEGPVFRPATPSVASTRSRFESASSCVLTPRPLTAERVTQRKVPVANRRHRRSRSADAEVWLEHRPTMAVPLNTVMQPHLNKRKSVTKLTDAKDVTEKTSKYCLMTQNQDSDGDLETRLYKGDVIPTAGGGAQVMFNDVEVLKQVSPNTSPKRRPDYIYQDPAPSCSVALEGHRLRSRRL